MTDKKAIFDPIFISNNKDDIANIINNILYLYSIREYHYRKTITEYVKPNIYYIYKILCEYIDTEKNFLICNNINNIIIYKKGNIHLKKIFGKKFYEDYEYKLQICSPIEIEIKFTLEDYIKINRERNLLKVLNI